MKVKMAVLLMALALAASPALAQTPGVGQDTSRDTSNGATRQDDNTQTKTLETKRGAGIGTTVNAANIVLPGMAQLPVGDPLLGAEDMQIGLTVCKIAEGYKADVIPQINKELDGARTFQKEKPVSNWNAVGEYAVGDTMTFSDPRTSFDKQREEFDRNFNSFGGKTPPATKGWLDGDFKVAEIHLKEGWLGLTGPGIAQGKVLQWFPGRYHDPVSRSVTVTNDPERNAVLEKAKAAWAALTPETAAPICVGAVTRTFLASNQLGWPVPHNAMGVWARAATMENLTYLEMARDIATRIQAIKYKDNAVAIQHATLIATQLAPVYVQKHKDLIAATHEGKDIAITTDGTGKCGQGWSATVQGQNYDFCGSQHGFDISAAGGKWAGEGWLAGAKTEISFSQSGSATVTEADSVLHSKTAAFLQSIKAMLGIGK